LGKDKEEALRKFHELMSGRRKGHTIKRVDKLLDEYMEHVKHNGVPHSYRLQEHYLGLFNATIPNKRMHDVDLPETRSSDAMA
jgi:hypothetical protein